MKMNWHLYTYDNDVIISNTEPITKYDINYQGSIQIVGTTIDRCCLEIYKLNGSFIISHYFSTKMSSLNIVDFNFRVKIDNKQLTQLFTQLLDNMKLVINNTPNDNTKYEILQTLSTIIRVYNYHNDRYVSLSEELEGVEVPFEALPKRAN